MPVPPAELNAHFTIAGPAAARERALAAALDGGAHTVDVRLETPTEARR